MLQDISGSVTIYFFQEKRYVILVCRFLSFGGMEAGGGGDTYLTQMVSKMHAPVRTSPLI